MDGGCNVKTLNVKRVSQNHDLNIAFEHIEGLTEALPDIYLIMVIQIEEEYSIFIQIVDMDNIFRKSLDA